jgi:glycosyltransferase involved in cell wall biosynthesis
MAMGKALVSTSIGAEGLGVQSERDLILADTASAFADAVLSLLRDATLRRRYEQATVKLARQYDWSGIVEKFAAVLCQTVQVFSGEMLAHPVALREDS